jgi:hypothetical protein
VQAGLYLGGNAPGQLAEFGEGERRRAEGGPGRPGDHAELQDVAAGIGAGRSALATALVEQVRAAAGPERVELLGVTHGSISPQNWSGL